MHATLHGSEHGLCWDDAFRMNLIYPNCLLSCLSNLRGSYPSYVGELTRTSVGQRHRESMDSAVPLRSVVPLNLCRWEKAHLRFVGTERKLLAHHSIISILYTYTALTCRVLSIG